MTASTPQRPTRIISIDFGLARVGMAVSDPMKIIATALPTVAAERGVEATAAKIAQVLSQAAEQGGYAIETIVIGLPLRMNGQVGLMADDVKLFAEALGALLPGIPIVLWDERLTSVQAERTMREGHMTRRQRSKAVDRIAAVIILQNYLDSRSFS